MFLRLNCFDCENSNCTKCPTGTYISVDIPKGCLREVSEEDYISYFHYINEMLPFLDKFNMTTRKEILNDTEDFLQHIYKDTNICGSQIQPHQEPEEPPYQE